jgi:hypothetical protein
VPWRREFGGDGGGTGLVSTTAGVAEDAELAEIFMALVFGARV